MSQWSNLLIGQYFPGNSWVHRLDPRTKLITVFLFVIILFMANNPITYTLIGLFVWVALLGARVPFSYILRGLKPIWIILIVTFLFHLIFTQRGEVLLQWGIIKLYDEGLIQGAIITARLGLLVIVSTLLTLTTKPITLTDGLEKLLSPLKRFRFPAHEFALMTSIALRFIPTLWEETEKIMKAQQSRGVSFSTGSLLKRVKSFVPILVPLFISSIQRAEDLALAMEARGYQGGEGRTQLRQIQMTAIDTIACVSVGLWMIAILVLRGW